MSIALQDERAFIEARLPLAAVPDAPAIRLHLAGPRSGLGALADLIGDDARSPYWAFAWAGGAVLAKYILAHPERVAGRRVLDLGTGSGLVAIAAALAGAGAVEAVDTDPVALVAARLNAEANGVEIATRLADPAAGPWPGVELVCAGDVFYGPEAAAASLPALERWRAAGAEVLVGDPWRQDLPSDHLKLIASDAVRDFGDGAKAVEAGVFTLAG